MVGSAVEERLVRGLPAPLVVSELKVAWTELSMLAKHQTNFVAEPQRYQRPEIEMPPDRCLMD
eukprot:scaffold5591_cov98-Cylindrotheca_fusiformis.AAC.1